MEEYIHSLHKLADTCDFGVAKEGNICNRLVIGIKPDLTLYKAAELMRQWEQVKKHISDVAGV